MRSEKNTAAFTSGENISYWIDTAERLEFNAVKEDIDTEVLIIGAGLAGLSVAYALVKEGRDVSVLEDGYIGSGESGRTTAHLTCALDDRYSKIEHVYGEEGMKLVAKSHMAAIDFIEKAVKEHNIDCGFKRVNGYLFLHPSDKRETLEKEFEACKRAGLDVSWLDKTPGINVKSECICFHNQGQFHILKYLNGLAQVVKTLGGKIYCNSKARHVNEKGAECNGCKITARNIVVATNSPVNDFVTMHTKQFPYRTYVIGAKIPRGLTAALWWDSGDQDSKWYTAPYHYVRVDEYDDEYDLLISGGEDHITGQADDEGIPEEERFTKLVTWTKEKFPTMTGIVYKWSGQVLEPLDYMAYIGRNPGNDNVYIVTGDSGNGMTHATIAAVLIPDLIAGRENKWEKIYSPKRLPLKLPGKYLKEMASMMVQYADWLHKGDIENLDDLRSGEGGVFSIGLKHYVAYKNGNGELKVFSAVCPHMGCVLHWNKEEKSFDCPCHGSRFSKEGIVINGPATADLQQVRIKD
jgi:glycine/D-amino acid oxidase-like deaminating enzyme/nitrite reductase/ring-hydroxylating ferredoxin subunit